MPQNAGLNMSLSLALGLLAFIASQTVPAQTGDGNVLPGRGQRLSQESMKSFQLRSVPTGDLRPARAGWSKIGLNNESVNANTVQAYDTVPYWTDQFIVPGYDSNGNYQTNWPYTMVGTLPESGRTTTIKSPIVPLTFVGLDANGKVFRDPDTGTPIIQVVTPGILKAVVQSPFFESSNYTSGTGQYLDSMMRAQFWGRIHGGQKDSNWNNGWHNLLIPSVKTTRTIFVPFGKLYYLLNADNSCCALIAVDSGTLQALLFPQVSPADNSTAIGAAELAGDITPKDVATFLSNNVYLYIDDISTCCGTAFHSYDYEPGTSKNGNRPRLYVLNYSPWMTMGILNNNYGDVGAMSHEMAELFDDPFIMNFTPWWQSTDPAYGFPLCMNFLEVGDVIENFVSVPQIYTTLTHGRTYHVVNVANLSWFAGESPSQAHLGAYSFPDEFTLTTLSPPNLQPNCSNAP